MVNLGMGGDGGFICTGEMGGSCSGRPVAL